MNHNEAKINQTRLAQLLQFENEAAQLVERVLIVLANEYKSKHSDWKEHLTGEMAAELQLWMNLQLVPVIYNGRPVQLTWNSAGYLQWWGTVEGINTCFATQAFR